MAQRKLPVEHMAVVFAICGVLHYVKVLTGLKMTNDISLNVDYQYMTETACR